MEAKASSFAKRRAGLSLSTPSSSGLRSEENLESSGISREPVVSFVLRNILEVPEERVEGYLRHLGDPLEEWGMNLCGTCEETVVKAKQIYQEMQDAKKRFKEVKFEIISKIMSIQQGIKCGDRKPEAVVEDEDEGVTSTDNLQKPVRQFMDGEAEELLGQELELEGGDESALDNSAILCSQKIHQQVNFSTGECKTEIPGIAEDENLIEFEYHFKTEEPLSSECADTTKESVPAVENVLELGSNSNRFRTSAKVRSKASKRNRTKSHKSTVLATPKVKGTLKDPEKLFRCETCFRKEPSILATFKHKYNLTRHIQTVHQLKLSSCWRCGSSMRSDNIKKHLKSCRKSKS